MATNTVRPAVLRPGDESRGKAWGFTGLLMFLYMINWADKAVFGIIAQPVAKEFGLTSAQIGLIGSAFFLTFTIGGLFAGLLNKWMSLRWALVLLSVGWAVSMVPLVVVAGFAMVLISRMFLGLTEGPSSALVHTGVYSWHPTEKRSFPSACISVSGSLAKVLFAPALAVVATNWGWRAAVLTLAAVGVIWCGAWLLLWREGPYGGRSQSAEDPQNADASPAQDTTTTRVPWVTIFRTPTFLGGAAAVFSMYAVSTVILTWLPSYFEVGLGYTRVQAGAMFGIPSIAVFVILLLTTSIGDRLLVRGASSRVIRGIVPSIGILLCGLALVTLPYIHTPVIAVVLVSLGYGLGAIAFPLLNSGLSEICPPRQVAGALGIFLAIMSLGGLFAPYLMGRLVDAAPDAATGYASAFQILGIINLVCAVIALLTVNPVRDALRLAR
ncbi:MFS transporter [Rhodococcus jostii]|uniref:MFS transporter n=1 Tax=Rhodococcus jostii TaxID=132919 RepID=A0ABU4C9D3_RHOJO|nr:MFS transporter [Rhodococcus jostii]MDV6280156.1 MFS transporter [Rhodococcus jostii]